MVHWKTDSQAGKQRVDQALDILRGVLVDHLSNLPHGSRKTYGSSDLQALLKAFVDRFPEMLLPSGARSLAFSAKEARNEIAHYTGAMGPDDALRHLANVRRLVKDLGAEKALQNVDRLYNEHLDSRRAPYGRRPLVVAPAPDPAPAAKGSSTPAAAGARGKYAPLFGHLTGLAENRWDATFRDVEAVLGHPLPPSARKHQAWWSNTTSLAGGRAWLAAGWRTSNVRIARETVSFVRDRGQRDESPRNSSGGLALFDNDSAYHDWLVRNRDGYVVNVRRTLSSDYVVLHRATCPHVSGPQEPGAFTERDYRKLCGETLADVLEAPTWCGRAKGAFTIRCSHCGP